MSRKILLEYISNAFSEYVIQDFGEIRISSEENNKRDFHHLGIERGYVFWKGKI